MLRSVEPFDPARHKRDRFTSGSKSVDNYLKLTARKLAAAYAAAVFVIADEDAEIVGYYALTSVVIDASDIGGSKPDKLFGRFKAVPATLIAMLGVDQHWQGQGIGKLLLADALRRSFASSRQVGSYCIVLDVLDEGNAIQNARRTALYESVGFRAFGGTGNRRMFLTMQSIERIGRGA